MFVKEVMLWVSLLNIRISTTLPDLELIFLFTFVFHFILLNTLIINKLNKYKSME